MLIIDVVNRNGAEEMRDCNNIFPARSRFGQNNGEKV
jgi:hypothetical protein